MVSILFPVPPRNEYQRIHFFGNLPRQLATSAKDTINKSNRPVIQRCPPTREEPRVVKRHDPVVSHEWRPLSPVALHSLFPVLAVTLKKKNRILPRLRCILAKLFDPHCPRF